MKLTAQVKVTENKTIVSDILCNLCGSSLKTNEDPIQFVGLKELTIHGGYFSTKLTDCTQYTFSLCEECLVEMFNKFKHPVEIKEN